MGLALAERYRRAGLVEEARVQLLRTVEDFAVVFRRRLH